MPEQQKQPKRNKKLSLCPMSFDEALEKIVKAGLIQKTKRINHPSKGKKQLRNNAPRNKKQAV